MSEGSHTSPHPHSLICPLVYFGWLTPKQENPVVNWGKGTQTAKLHHFICIWLNPYIMPSQFERGHLDLDDRVSIYTRPSQYRQHTLNLYTGLSLCIPPLCWHSQFGHIPFNMVNSSITKEHCRNIWNLSDWYCRYISVASASWSMLGLHVLVGACSPLWALQTGNFKGNWLILSVNL